jgi:hypothetical protein
MWLPWTELWRQRVVEEMLVVLTLVVAVCLTLAHGESGECGPARKAANDARGTPSAQQLGDLMAAAKPLGAVPAFENDYVRVHYTVLGYPAADSRIAERRPVVLYVRVVTKSGADTRPLDAPPRTPAFWRPGVLPRGVHVEVLTPPPAPSTLGEPGTDPPRGAIVEEHGEQYRLVLATFRSQDHGVGTGRLPSVTVFLSDGAVDVKSSGVRRRMGVQAGDAFWFEAYTQLTVVSDDPVAAASVQLRPRQEALLGRHWFRTTEKTPHVTRSDTRIPAQ